MRLPTVCRVLLGRVPLQEVVWSVIVVHQMLHVLRVARCHWDVSRGLSMLLSTTLGVTGRLRFTSLSASLSSVRYYIWFQFNQLSYAGLTGSNSGCQWESSGQCRYGIELIIFMKNFQFWPSLCGYGWWYTVEIFIHQWSSHFFLLWN